MSYHGKNREWSRDWGSWRAASARGCGMLVLLVGLVTPAQGQQPDHVPAARALPEGIRLNGISTYAGGDWLQMVPAGSGPNPAPLWLLTTGAGADVAAYWGQRTRLAVTYHAGYSYNQKYSALNGVDHNVTLSFGTDPARHTVFTLSASGESGVTSDALFDPRYAYHVVQGSTSITDVATGLGTASPEQLLSSPVELALAGARRRAGAATAGITHTIAPRLTTFARVGAAREIHSYGGAQQVLVPYPNVTIATSEVGASYQLRPRTRITASAGYARSYTRLYRADWETAGLGVERRIGRRSFGSLQGAYVRMSEAGLGGSARNSYAVTGTFGTMKGFHTLAVTGSRGVASLHGLGAETTHGVEGVWSWAPQASSWTISSSVGYERLRGSAVGTVQAWIWQGNAVRRLARNFQVAFSTVYLSDTGAEVLGLNRRGVRISFTWTPGLEHGR